MRKLGYDHTRYACYVGYITQAIINNFLPLLFLTLRDSLGISLSQIALLVSVNFASQLAVDYLSSLFVDRIGYRASMELAHVCAAAGLMGLYAFPRLSGSAFAGLCAAVVLYAIGGGLLEVLVSPIVEACPAKNKAAQMSLLHSFYCWGHLAVILVSTAFFAAFGLSSWPVLACLWALVPICSCFLFAAVPMPEQPAAQAQTGEGGLLRSGVFWRLFLMMVCAGAAEQGMSQWASAFAESSLGVAKTTGDLLGPAMFALMMGLARAGYGKTEGRLPLTPAIAASSALCVICYLTAALAPRPLIGLAGCMICGFSVGILWPGCFSIAASRLPSGGTAMFAYLALAGDLGCASGPALVGRAADLLGGDLRKGLVCAVVFPLALIVCAALSARESAR